MLVFAPTLKVKVENYIEEHESMEINLDITGKSNTAVIKVMNYLSFSW